MEGLVFLAPASPLSPICWRSLIFLIRDLSTCDCSECSPAFVLRQSVTTFEPLTTFFTFSQEALSLCMLDPMPFTFVVVHD